MACSHILYTYTGNFLIISINAANCLNKYVNIKMNKRIQVLKN